MHYTPGEKRRVLHPRKTLQEMNKEAWPEKEITACHLRAGIISSEDEHHAISEIREIKLWTVFRGVLYLFLLTPSTSGKSC